MVRTIPHRELRNNSSRILEEVRRGETIHITNHGEVVATLVPPRAGTLPPQVYPARNPGGLRALRPRPAPNGLSTAEILDNLRGDR